MCIRDSDGRTLQQLLRLGQIGERYADSTIGAAAFADRLYPVSYTHLRAHETVLDLVCRLLLEKKKHKSI